MTDAELSKKLGHYQAMSVIWFWVGVVGAVSGVIFYFVLQNKALKSLLVAVLFLGGIFCASFFSGGAQKKLKALMHEQMGDFSAKNGKRHLVRISTPRKCALMNRS